MRSSTRLGLNVVDTEGFDFGFSWTRSKGLNDTEYLTCAKFSRALLCLAWVLSFL